MNEYQQEVKQTLELLFRAARVGNGRVLDAGAVRRICTYIQNLVRTIETMQVMLEGADGLLDAYVNEYGEELMNELTAEVVDGIIEEETGQPGEDEWLDTSDQGEEE